MKRPRPFNPSIQALCKFDGDHSLYAFGSVLTNRFDSESDADLIVDLVENDSLQYTENYLNLKFGSESLMGRSIDLLEETADLKPLFRKEIVQSKVIKYED